MRRDKIKNVNPTQAFAEAFRQVVQEAVREEIQPFRKEVNERFNKVDQRFDHVDQRIEALTADVMRLQDVTGAIWDKMALEDSRNKRDIDEIKGHLGLKPLDPL